MPAEIPDFIVLQNLVKGINHLPLLPDTICHY